MATMNGARALGMDGKIGELSERAFADLVCIPYAGKTSNVHEGIMGQKGTVAASMIGGQWAIQPGTQKPGH
jgi:cytosine/adenosine deaminase-related metal-dependent hydrolase